MGPATPTLRYNAVDIWIQDRFKLKSVQDLMMFTASLNRMEIESTLDHRAMVQILSVFSVRNFSHFLS